MGKDLNDNTVFQPTAAVMQECDLLDLLPENVALAMGLDRRVIGCIAAAALNADRFGAEEALLACMERGIDAESLIDRYIPQVANLLGECWCQDRLGFAEVTIGVARLQGHLRMLELHVTRPDLSPAEQPAVLLVVTPECYHTLGPLVALSQFRRLGASVRLLLAQTGDDVGIAIEEGGYDMVAIAATGHERLETLRGIVEIVQSAACTVPPIVVGGSILDAEPETHILIGADHATRNPDEALTLCGLQTKTSGVTPCADAG